MNFAIKPLISDCPDIHEFLDRYALGEHDLVVSNENLLKSALGDVALPCDVLYQERFGHGEPSDEMVDAMLSAMTKNYRRIVAIGGGTVIDIAKLFVFGRDLRCRELFARGAELKRTSTLIAVPTTCGTGSEVTGISIVAFLAKGTKLGLATEALYPDEAVLIPSLLATLPYSVFATSSIDALIHAVEAHVSPKANDFTRAMGAAAMSKIVGGYMSMVENNWLGCLPKDLSGFLSAGTMAGVAFANAGVGAVHALSYPIGAKLHLAHGLANYLVFGAVFQAYREQGADLSPLEGVLAPLLGRGASGDVWAELAFLLDKILIRTPLASLGVTEADCAEMAESVVRNQQRLLGNNPLPLSQTLIEEIYRRCM